MNEIQSENNLSMWCSTYGLITAERILERYQIRLKRDELLAAIKNQHSIYHLLLSVPLKNVLNGIILQQVSDYQVYAQKLFIDYFLSGETVKVDEAAGGNIREELEVERNNLIKLGESFHADELSHEKLIVTSQATLINLSHDWQTLLQLTAKNFRSSLEDQGMLIHEDLSLKAISSAMIYHDATDRETLAVYSPFWGKLSETLNITLSDMLRQQQAELFSELSRFTMDVDIKLTQYVDQASQLNMSFRDFRKQFFDLIVRVNEQIKQLPDYRYDRALDTTNRESLYFDTGIGEQA